MNAVTIVGVVSVFGLVFLWLLALCAEKGAHPLGRVRQGFHRLPGWEKTLILIFVSVWIAFAGTKDGTNQMENVELKMGNGLRADSILHSPFYTLHSDVQGLPTSITADDVAQMWRIGATVDGNAFAAPTANAVTNAAWCDYGGMSDSLRIRPEGWHFPYGNGTTTGLTVFENGDFRPNVKTHFFPSPFNANLSLLPRMNWGLLPDGGESVFWHEQTPSNSLVLTWHNALYNRDVSCPTNFQAELFADGRFDYRYPDRTVQYAPVFPFDWDGDGLENSVDPEPRVAGPDTHGTNAEWYGTVCSNVFTKANSGNPGGSPVLLPNGESIYFYSGVNANAYYFVNVVAESLAPIYIEADGDSRLGDLVVVARAGESNLVPLLIGADYRISSSTPIDVFAPTNVLVEQTFAYDDIWDQWCPITHVKWPVDLGCSTSGEGTGTTLVPFASEDSRLLGKFDWIGGCCMVYDGSNVTYQCHSCACGGCSVTLAYLYEGYALYAQVPSCGCEGHGQVIPDAPYVETDSGGRVSVGFDKRYLVMAAPEHGATNAVSRSTRSVLCLRADGGIHGGVLTVQPRNFDKLAPVDGMLPPAGTQAIPPYSIYEVVVTNEASAASDRMHDVELLVSFRENDTNLELRRRANLTVCKFTVDGIKFNHDVGAYTNDAINIRADGTPGGAYDLDNGEWSGNGLTNFCACYVGGTLPHVKVRFKVQPHDLSTAKFSANASTAGFVLGNLQTNQVAFVDGVSQWIDFHPVETNAIPAMVKKYVSKWQWDVHEINEKVFETFLVDSSGEHIVYTVLAHPSPPWRQEKDNLQCAWACALERISDWAEGATTKNAVISAVTSNLFYNMGFSYDTKNGLARYYSRGTFDLFSYLNTKYVKVNCFDQAYGVVSMSNIAGTSVVPLYTSKFGYLNVTNLVGVGACNNPVYACEGRPLRYVVTNGVLVQVGYAPSRMVVCGDDDIDRTFFSSHVYAASGGMVFDACSGPIMGDLDLVTYLNRVIDHSTTNECINGYFSPYSSNTTKMLPWNVMLRKEQK